MIHRLLTTLLLNVLKNQVVILNALKKGEGNVSNKLLEEHALSTVNVCKTTQEVLAAGTTR